jgi:ornithine carbamoyltransferase
MARLFKHDDLLELAENSEVPVINGLTDLLHPCQVLADLLTIREQKGKLRGLKLAYVGDGNNVCNSLLLGCSKTGVDISVATPKGYAPDTGILKQAKREAKASKVKVDVITDPREAVTDADVVYTDVWTSMGQEKERERRLRDFKGYQVDSKLLEEAKPDTIFMHCLPAHRGEEVTAEVIDGPRSVVFNQAENRLHVQKAILVQLV